MRFFMIWEDTRQEGSSSSSNPKTTQGLGGGNGGEGEGFRSSPPLTEIIQGSCGNQKFHSFSQASF